MEAAKTKLNLEFIKNKYKEKTGKKLTNYMICETLNNAGFKGETFQSINRYGNKGLPTVVDKLNVLSKVYGISIDELIKE